MAETGITTSQMRTAETAGTTNSGTRIAETAGIARTTAMIRTTRATITIETARVTITTGTTRTIIMAGTTRIIPAGTIISQVVMAGIMAVPGTIGVAGRTRHHLRYRDSLSLSMEY